MDSKYIIVLKDENKKENVYILKQRTHNLHHFWANTYLLV